MIRRLKSNKSTIRRLKSNKSTIRRLKSNNLPKVLGTVFNYRSNQLQSSNTICNYIEIENYLELENICLVLNNGGISGHPMDMFVWHCLTIML